MMRKRIEKLLQYVQLPLLLLSYYYFKILTIQSKEKKIWLIGVDDIASNIFFIGNILNNSTTVSLSKNKFYNLKYDYSINIENKYLLYMLRVFYGPLLLGYLANTHLKFFYIWNSGFLLNRAYEFKFLKSLDKKIVCLFVGDDIRSLKLTIEYAKKHDIDTYANYYPNNSKGYEIEKQKLALSADNYADLIFSSKYDQISYLTSKQHSWVYTYDKKKFSINKDKFNNVNIKILHAPSNAIYKGTQLVRAAIKKLKLQGYTFEYIELQNIPNKVVLEHLKTSQIVLNSFYSFAPGLFGIEAMANNCCVLMSADPNIETSLPKDSQDAWMITKYWQVYDNLKYLLDNPEKIKYYADNGYEFTYKHYTYESAGEYINKVFKENGVID